MSQLDDIIKQKKYRAHNDPPPRFMGCPGYDKCLNEAAMLDVWFDCRICTYDAFIDEGIRILPVVSGPDEKWKHRLNKKGRPKMKRKRSGLRIVGERGDLSARGDIGRGDQKGEENDQGNLDAGRWNGNKSNDDQKPVEKSKKIHRECGVHDQI